MASLSCPAQIGLLEAEMEQTRSAIVRTQQSCPHTRAVPTIVRAHSSAVFGNGSQENCCFAAFGCFHRYTPTRVMDMNKCALN